jgi:conjugative relaxase-like TrwC/TraI family protein
MRMMGADSVTYHEANVANRADDHAGAALDYYGSRGETRIRWGGSGAHMLGVEGEAIPESYRAVFGPGGARLPRTGAQLVSTRRPGIELVVSPHKSVAELGVLGRADDMHAIVDAERDATLAYLDRMCREIGGRRGEAATPTKTGGLTWATSRHATTRAGDPQVHDHVLIANVVWMRDDRGGWKALDTAFLRDQLHAATAIGRMAAARVAVELGYAIVPDEGRSGRLGGWRIGGIPDEALAVHAKRSAQIDDIAGPGASYRARNAAAREHRDPKTHEPVADLISRWRAELTAAGHPPAALVAGIEAAASRRPRVRDRAGNETTGRVVGVALGPDDRLAEVKVFDRADVIVAVAPHLHGLPVTELDSVVDAVIAHPDCIPLLGVAGARTQAYATAGVLAAEDRIAALAEELVGRWSARVDQGAAHAAIAGVEERIGVPMSVGQARAAESLLTSSAGLELLVGVAGSGKTTTLLAVRAGFEASGFTVIGTATSGQAARGLGEGAGIAESRTIASLGWRLDHDQLRLTDRHVICLDEGGMTDDIDLARILTAAHTAGAKVIISGDDCQLGAIGPGGGLGALLRRHPERISRLTDNVRQVDPGERRALAELRSGTVDKAVAWYATNGRINPQASADAAVAAAVEAWAADVAAGQDSLLLAWQRDTVDALNAAARQAWVGLGRLVGPGDRSTRRSALPGRRSGRDAQPRTPRGVGDQRAGHGHRGVGVHRRDRGAHRRWPAAAPVTRRDSR